MTNHHEKQEALFEQSARESTHLVMAEGDALTICERPAREYVVEVAQERTYGTPYCVDCSEAHRRVLAEAGVDVALLDCQRRAQQRAAA